MGKLLIVESLFLAIGGILLGLLMLAVVFFLFQAPLEQNLGFQVPIFALTPIEILYLVFVLVGAVLVTLLPATISYKQSLSDGLTVKT